MCNLGVLTGQAEWGNAGSEGILRAVANYYDVPRARMLWKVRNAKVDYARNVAYLVLRRKLRWSYPRIAAAMNRNNHTTVMSGVKAARSRVSAKDFEEIRKRLRFDVVALAPQPVEAELHEFYFEASA